MIRHDFRQAARSFRQHPGFAVMAMLTMAIGLGACTIIFSVVYDLLLAPLHYPDPDRIVALNTRWQRTGRRAGRLSGTDLTGIRQASDVFAAIGYSNGGEMGVQLSGRAEFAGAYFVNADFFRVFQLTPAAGRLVNSADADRAAVVSASFARRNFGGVHGAVGGALSIDKRTYTIAGVLPDGFSYPARADVWVAAPDRPLYPDIPYPVVARLRSGTTLAAAQAELSAIAPRLATHSHGGGDRTFFAIRLQDQLTGPLRASLYILLGAVFLLLLIACMNVANLLLARSTVRSREIAVRAALGAGRRRLYQQLLVESVTLGLAGGAAGLILATVGFGIFIRYAPQGLPRLNDAAIHWQVLLFAAACSLAASMVFGLIPAWKAARVDLNSVLKRGGDRTVTGGGSGRLRQSLIIAEIALSTVLAVGAGLLFRSFLAMRATDLGFRTEKLLVMYAHVPAGGLQEYLNAPKLIEDLFPQLRAIPGVTSVAAAMGVPAGQYEARGAYEIEGKQTPEREYRPQAGLRLASPGYFSTMGISLKAGRDLAAADRYQAPLVAVVSESLARQSFATESPIGKRIWCGFNAPHTWMRIVGVVGDVRQQPAVSSIEPEIYMPLEQHPYYANELQIVLRTAAEPASFADAARRIVQAASPSIATKFTTMEAMTSALVATPRLRTVLVGLFAGLALLLAAAGVYGVMANVMEQRTAEIGLRVALGATAGDVLWLILGQTAGLAAVGLSLGGAAAIAAGQLLKSLLFGVQPTDLATYSAIGGVILITAMMAALVPAMRAARIDPVVALRDE